MTLLICYTNYYGAHVFFLPWTQSMLKPALPIIDADYADLVIFSDSSRYAKKLLNALEESGKTSFLNKSQSKC